MGEFWRGLAVSFSWGGGVYFYGFPISLRTQWGLFSFSWAGERPARWSCQGAADIWGPKRLGNPMGDTPNPHLKASIIFLKTGCATKGGEKSVLVFPPPPPNCVKTADIGMQNFIAPGPQESPLFFSLYSRSVGGGQGSVGGNTPWGGGPIGPLFFFPHLFPGKCEYGNRVSDTFPLP